MCLSPQHRILLTLLPSEMLIFCFLLFMTIKKKLTIKFLWEIDQNTVKITVGKVRGFVGSMKCLNNYFKQYLMILSLHCLDGEFVRTQVFHYIINVLSVSSGTLVLKAFISIIILVYCKKQLWLWYV